MIDEKAREEARILGYQMGCLTQDQVDELIARYEAAKEAEQPDVLHATDEIQSKDRLLASSSTEHVLQADTGRSECTPTNPDPECPLCKEIKATVKPIRGHRAGRPSNHHYIGEIDPKNVTWKISPGINDQPDELPGAYPMPEHGWTCFHCGEKFKKPGAARDHFGSEPINTPACKYGGNKDVLMALRRTQDLLRAAQNELAELRAPKREIVEVPREDVIETLRNRSGMAHYVLTQFDAAGYQIVKRPA